jgi:hypothetical protein
MSGANQKRDVMADAVKCKELMTARAQSVRRDDYYEYEAARLSVVSDPTVAEDVPE